MAYEIPQQLAYKEKIIFGLTFKQLIYAFLSLITSAIFIKSATNNTVGFILAILPIFCGICFMFFDFDQHLKNYYIFLKSKKLIKGTLQLQNFIGVKGIEKDCIVTSNNKKVSIIKVRPINFSIKPSAEKEAIIKSFQKFLNSLDFSTQIIMNTESIELDRYTSLLKSKIKNKLFLNLFEDYKKHLNKVISNSKIMNRVFYLVIPENTDIEIQTNICMDRLRSLNLKIKRLNSLELKILLKKSFYGKGKGNFIDSLSPEVINTDVNYLEVDGKYHRIIYANGYPRMVENGFLDKIVSSLGDFDLSIHIKPYPIEGMLIDLNRELQKQRADLFSMQMKGIINPSLEIQHTDTRKTLKDLQKGKERLFNISLYISCKADSLKELDLLTKKVESELNSIMILPKTANLRMLQGYKSTSPLGIDELNVSRNITTEPLSAFFPFTSQFLQADDNGVWLGLNRNGIPIIKDIFNLPNPNGLILAQSGGGKSYFSKLLISRYLLNGTKVMVIDPQGEYRNLIDHFKGQRIDLSRKSNTMINPLDLMGHDYVDKRLSLMDLMKVMLGDLSDIQKAFIDKAITETYELKGINQNSDTWDNTPPILEDLLYVLEKIEKKATRLEKTTLRSLINRLNMYVNGVFSFFNQHTNIDFDNNFVCFDIGEMPNQVKPPIMFLILDYVYMKMRSNLNRKILLIDEAWSLLSRTEDSDYIFEIVKTSRKFNLGLLLINQEVEGLLNSKAGKSVLANSSYTLLMRQKPAVIENICKAFHLSSSEKNHLLTADIGEGLLIMEDDHSEIKVIASPEEHKLITTNADEIIKGSEKIVKPKLKLKKVKKPKEVAINVDKDKGIFRKSKLNADEIKYLLSKGYKIAEYRGLNLNKKEKFLLKPRFNESLTHFFVVKDIEKFLEKYNIKSELFVTKKPDIEFKIGDKKWAIEVETGSALANISRLKEKVKLLNKNYNNWFFIVTNKNKVRKYKRFGNTSDLRYLKAKLEKMLKNRSKKNRSKKTSYPRKK